MLNSPPCSRGFSYRTALWPCLHSKDFLELDSKEVLSGKRSEILAEMNFWTTPLTKAEREMISPVRKCIACTDARARTHTGAQTLGTAYSPPLLSSMWVCSVHTWRPLHKESFDSTVMCVCFTCEPPPQCPEVWCLFSLSGLLAHRRVQ